MVINIPFKNVRKVLNTLIINLIFIFLLNSVLSLEKKTEDDLLIELTEVNALNLITNTDCYMIHFYDSNCEVCQNLISILEETAFLVFSEGIRCRFFNYNISNNKNIDISNWVIKDIPSIFLVNQQKNLKILYEGIRDSDIIVKFIKDNIGEYKFKKLKNLNELKFLNENVKGNILLVFGNENENNNILTNLKKILFNQIYDDNSYFLKNFTTYEKSLSKLNNYFEMILFLDKNTTFIQFLNFTDNYNTFFPNRSFDEKDLIIFTRTFNRIDKKINDYEYINISNEDWDKIENNAEHLIILLSYMKFPFFDFAYDEKINHIFDTGDSSFILFLKNKEDYQKLILDNNFTSPNSTLYKKFRKRIHFTVSILEDKSTLVVKDVLGLTEEKLPVFFFTKKEQNIKYDDLEKYVQENCIINLKEIINFIENIDNKKIEKFLVSENLTSEQNNELKVLNIVGFNFESFIMQNRNILFIICTRISKTCKNFQKIINRIFYVFSNNIPDNLIIGLTDPNFNDYRIDLGKSVIPKIYFFRKNYEKNNLNSNKYLSSILDLYNKTYILNNKFDLEELVHKFEQKIVFNNKFTTGNIIKFILENILEENKLKTLNKFENETLIDLDELENLITAVDLENEEKREDDLDYESIVDSSNLDKTNIAKLFQSFGGEIKEDGDLNINVNIKDKHRLNQLEALRDLFENVNNKNLLNERLKKLKDFSIVGDIESLTEEEKIKRINELLDEYYQYDFDKNNPDLDKDEEDKEIENDEENDDEYSDDL